MADLPAFGGSRHVGTGAIHELPLLPYANRRHSTLAANDGKLFSSISSRMVTRFRPEKDMAQIQFKGKAFVQHRICFAQLPFEIHELTR